MTTRVEQTSPRNWTVYTDLPPQYVDAVGRYIFAKWMAFALGQTDLNGRRIIYPSGRYAAALEYQKLGESEVMIVAHESASAPEVAILETGHKRVDLKDKLKAGAYPMHRFRNGLAGNPSGLRRNSRNTTKTARAALTASSAKRASMWGEMRSNDANGFASIGPNSAPDSWIIPEMPAYAPSMVLASIAESRARQLQGPS